MALSDIYNTDLFRKLGTGCEQNEAPPQHVAHTHFPLLMLNGSLIITIQSAEPVVIKQTMKLRLTEERGKKSQPRHMLSR